VLENEAKGLFDKITRGGGRQEKGEKEYSFVLELLLRMRQFAVRPALRVG
jgi:hypothetical protein